MNTGQVCTAATRILVPKSMKSEFEEAVKNILLEFSVGDPQDKNSFTGPLVSKKQWNRVKAILKKAPKKARPPNRGTGKPEGLDKGYFVKPTVFTDVKNDMVIAQEEIFGPVMSIITYET